MIRVGATDPMVVDYDEVSEALGEESGFFARPSSRRACPRTTAG
jgi:hypothetical protein